MYFRDVEEGQEFCFIWINETNKRLWCTKINSVLYENINKNRYSVEDQPDGRESIVYVEVKSDI